MIIHYLPIILRELWYLWSVWIEKEEVVISVCPPPQWSSSESSHQTGWDLGPRDVSSSAGETRHGREERHATARETAGEELGGKRWHDLNCKRHRSLKCQSRENDTMIHNSCNFIEVIDHITDKYRWVWFPLNVYMNAIQVALRKSKRRIQKTLKSINEC